MCNSKLNLVVNLNMVKHREEIRLKIRFPYDAEAGERVKLLKDRRWSQTMRAWHLPFDKDSVDALSNIFQHLEFNDEESRALAGLPATEQKPKDDVLIWKHEGYIYLKIKVNDLRARSFLSKLEMSRNYYSSGYWKIKETEAVTEAITKRFGSGLLQWPKLPYEIEQYETEHQMRNKVTVVVSEKRVRVIAGRNPEIIAFLKTMPFHKWDPVNKWWTFAYGENQFRAFIEFCRDKKLELLVDNVPVLKRAFKRNYDKNSPGYRSCPAEMLEKLQNMRYSQRTIEQYCSIFEEFINYHRKVALEDIGTKEIQEFIRYLVQERMVSPSTQNLAVNAIKFYYEKVLGGPRRFIEIDRPRMEKKLPEVLSLREVHDMIETTKNQKHKLIIVILYSTGMRRGELIQTKLADIDRENMRIMVRSGKGKKDRYVQLAKRTLDCLDKYLELYKPQEYLFEGEHVQYSTASIAKIVQTAGKRAGIEKHVTPHMLRHSYATHLLEQGVDTRYIKDLLGHASIKTTTIYEHVTHKGINNIENPFDKMDF